MKFVNTKQLVIKNRYKLNNKQQKYNPILTKCNYGIVVMSYCLITLRQINTLRRYLLKRVPKKNFKYFRTSLSTPLFKKSSKARMGKGLGKFYKWFGYLSPGTVLFEFILYKENFNVFLNYFKYICTKIPFTCYLLNKSLIFYLFK